MFNRVKQQLREMWELLCEAISIIDKSDLQMMASSLAFTTMISMVPLLAVGLSAFAAFGDFEPMLDKLERFLVHHFIEASGAELGRYIRHALERARSGVLGFWGVVGLLISSTKLFHDIELAVQKIWRTERKRGLLSRFLVYWVVMFICPLLFAAALGVMGSKDFGLIQLFPRSFIAIIFAFVAFFCIYKWVPECQVSSRSALISALCATVAIGVAKQFYATIMVQILRYSSLYGSLASIPIFLIWLLLLWWISLVGVALCAALEKKSKHEIVS